MILNKNYKNIYGIWKQNKIKDLFKSKEEFDNKINNYVVNKTFEEYEEIFKQMIDSSEFISNYFV